MHGLPKHFDPNFFVGTTLEQLCFTENQVTFHFSSDIHITVESAVAYRDAAGHGEGVFQVPMRQSSLMELIGDGVQLATASDDGSLLIVFASGRALTCLDTSKQYESYSIRRGEDVVIV